MGTMVSEGEKKFIFAPTGLQQAVCYGEWDLGWQKVEWEGKEKIMHKLMLGFELKETIESGEYEGKRFCVFKKYTALLSDKATLRKDLESWRGREFTKDELKGFDIGNVVGKGCMLNITHKEANGKTYVNISSISPLMKGMENMIPENSSVTPDWIKKIQGEAVDDVETIEPGPIHSDNESEEIPF